jgi:hypothetical protein
VDGTGSLTAGAASASNKVTLTKATLIGDTGPDAITLAGAGTITLPYSSGGAELVLADSGTVVTAGTGAVVVVSAAAGLTIGGAATTVTATTDGTGGIVIAAASGKATVTIPATSVANDGLALTGGMALTVNTTTGGVYEAVGVYLKGTDVIVAADPGTLATSSSAMSLKADAKSRVVLCDGSLILGNAATVNFSAADGYLTGFTNNVTSITTVPGSGNEAAVGTAKVTTGGGGTFPQASDGSGLYKLTATGGTIILTANAAGSTITKTTTTTCGL